MMASPSSPNRERASALPIFVGSLFASAMFFTSWIHPRLFEVFVVLVVFIGARELIHQINQTRPGISSWPASIGAAVFPIAYYRWLEGGPLLSTAFILIFVSTIFVFRGLRPDALRSIATSVLVAGYIGLLGSFLILVRRLPEGHRLIAALILMLIGYTAGKWAGESSLGGHNVAPGFSDSPTWWGAPLGVVGTLVGALVSLLFLKDKFSFAPIVGLAFAVGLAMVVGDVAAGLFRSDAHLSRRQASVPGQGGILVWLHLILMAAPALFFGFRLYLT